MTTWFYARTTANEEQESGRPPAEMIQDEFNRMQNTYQDLDTPIILEDNGIEWSASLQQRSRGRRLLSQMKEGDSVCIASLERMFSSVEEVHEGLRLFMEKEVTLIVDELGDALSDRSLTLPVHGLLRSLTRLEQRRSREKVKSIKRSQKKQGRFLGGSRPFGYMVHSNGRLIENPMEQRVLRKILALRERGKSLRKISEIVSTPMMPISFKTVQRIIKRHEEEHAPGKPGYRPGSALPDPDQRVRRMV